MGFKTSCLAPVILSLEGISCALFTSDSCGCCIAFICKCCYQNCECSSLHCSLVKDILKESMLAFSAFAAVPYLIWERFLFG